MEKLDRATNFGVALLLSLSLMGIGQARAAAKPWDGQLLEQLSHVQAIPLEHLKIAHRSRLNYPLTGVELTAVKVLDTTTGEAYLATVDAHGKPADVAAAAAAEEAAKVDKFGKIDPRLHALLAEVPEHGTIPVSIWLDTLDPPLSRGPGAVTAEEAQATLAAHLDAVRQHVAPQRQGVLNALARIGVQGDTPSYGPTVFAELTRGQIQAISRHPDVSAIYGPERYTRFLDDASTTHRAHRVWAAGNLGFVTSSRPVVHEDDGVADSNPYLNNASHPVIFWCSDPSGSCAVGKNIADHATEVAGVIASTHALFRGIAPSSQLILSANFQSFDNPGFDQRAVDSFEWARGNGGDPTNMSWGTVCGGFQTFMSRYVDWATRNLFATFVIAAGNHPTPCGNATEDEKVSAPGLAWSVITVGSQEDDNTGFWSGDSMSGFSDWRNPDFSLGMEKPEVVAVGQNIRTTDAQGGDHLTAVGVSGTSFAAPMVAGQVAQMLSRRPGQNQWPETNKAAVLASAFHDIEANPADRRDGVGSVVMNISDDTYRLGRFINDSGAASDFPRDKLDVLSLTAGQRVRVAIAWDSDSNGSTTDVLGADIDLRVRHPDNSTIVCASVSIQNAWEMCEFTAPVSGTYDILINLFDCPSYPGGDVATRCAAWPGTFLGIAWSIQSLPNFCTGFTSVPSTGGTFSINTATGSTFFDSYAGWSFNQSGRERVLRLILSTTKDITVTDTHGSLDLHILQFPSCSADPIVPTVLANGGNSVSINNAASGTYYIVVDGLSGAVGTTTVTVSVTGP